MAETTLDLRHLPKAEAYAQLDAHVRAVLAGVDDPVTAMATVSCLVHHAFGHLWTGFYRVVDDGRLLRVGPYQGTLGCLEIAFGRGVCGTAAAERRTVVVDDVHAFPGHIACDAASRSELVVPIVHEGELVGVLDLDSPSPARFDGEDATGCSELIQKLAGRLAHMAEIPPMR